MASQFDVRRFAKLAKEAHVDSITVFAKCHHGHLYFNTRHPARHPALPRKPAREPLPLTWADGRAEVMIPWVDGHQMVVFE